MTCRFPMAALVLVATAIFAPGPSLSGQGSGQGSGLVAIQSAHTVPETVERLQEVISERGMRVFSSIDHAAGAQSIGEELRPTVLLLFGNPTVGTGLMKCRQSVGIDLPMKFLVWEDAESKVWIGFNDPAFLGRRHSMSGCDQILTKVENALTDIAMSAGT
jgi:uncharacterized protein (DUF302 family)